MDRQLQMISQVLRLASGETQPTISFVSVVLFVVAELDWAKAVLAAAAKAKSLMGIVAMVGIVEK